MNADAPRCVIQQHEGKVWGDSLYVVEWRGSRSKKGQQHDRSWNNSRIEFLYVVVYQNQRRCGHL